VNEWWPFLSLAVLGAYHGVNPGMGWLFAVARGLQERSRTAVLTSVVPIAIGHEASVVVIVLGVGAAQYLIPATALRILAAAGLLAFAAYRLRRLRTHPQGFGMRVGPAGLMAWSFLMSSAHGAGLMLVPLLLAWPAFSVPAGSAPADLAYLLSGRAVLAASLHTAAMLAVMTAVALAVYQRFGTGLLRRAWFNLDLAWTGALLLASAVVLFT